MATLKYYFSFYAEIIIAGISIICHSFGILSIHLCTKKMNQNIILASLSLFEILASIAAILYTVSQHLRFVEAKNDMDIDIFLRCVQAWVSFAIVFLMGILTVDRLCMAKHPHKYKDIMTRRRVQIIVGIAIVVGFVLGTLKGALPSSVHSKRINVALLIIVIAYIIFSVATYAFIIYKLRKMSPQQQDVGLKFRKKFLVPLIIVSTFILLYVIPIAILIFVYQYWSGGIAEKRSKSAGFGICLVLPMFGFFCDSITYLFLTGAYRKAFFKLFSQ